MDPITAGILSAALFEAIKYGTKKATPKLKGLLQEKGWLLEDNTAQQVQELLPLITGEQQSDLVALTKHVESSSLWQTVIKEIKQIENTGSQEIYISGDAKQSVFVKGDGNTIRVDNSEPKTEKKS